MKTPSRKLVIGVVFIVIAAGVAYWMGSSSGTVPVKSVTVPPAKPISKAVPNIPPVAIAATGAKPADQPPPVVGITLKQLDQLANSPTGGGNQGQIAGLIKVLAHFEPALALSKVGLIDDPKLRNTLTGQIYGAWLATQTPQGLAALAQLPDGKQTQAYYLQAFQHWANGGAENANAPILAATAALGLSPGPNQEQALKGVATSWAQYDPQAVLNWASGLQPTNTTAMYSAVVAASATDPSLAAQYVNQLTDASAQSNAIQNIAVNMIKTDPTATLAWLNQVATGETYDDSVAKLISTVVVKNPTLASALMAQVTEPGESNIVSTSVANSNWARVNPQDAAAWLQTLPESPARDAAIQKLVPSTSGN